MAANKLIIVQEIESRRYRIIEAFPTSDGWRSRLCDFSDLDLATTKNEITRRENIVEEYFGG